MIDSSGSTLNTDPNEKYRVQTIQTFIQNYGNLTNLNYNFAYFSGSASAWDAKTSAFVTLPSSPQIPFGTSSDLSKALTAYSAIPIGQKATTNYLSAFTSLQASITKVAVKNDGWNYVVVFMSDGQPKDLGSTPNVQLAAIKSNVDGLLSTVQSYGSLLTVSAVYFGDEADSTSIANLQGMASEGGGQFVDTNKTTNVVISDIINVPVTTCH